MHWGPGVPGHRCNLNDPNPGQGGDCGRSGTWVQFDKVQGGAVRHTVHCTTLNDSLLCGPVPCPTLLHSPHSGISPGVRHTAVYSQWCPRPWARCIVVKRCIVLYSHKAMHFTHTKQCIVLTVVSLTLGTMRLAARKQERRSACMRCSKEPESCPSGPEFPSQSHPPPPHWASCPHSGPDCCAGSSTERRTLPHCT